MRREIRGRLGAWALVGCALFAGCADPSGPVRFFPEGQPRQLSAWRVVEVRDGALVLNDRVVPYDLETPLFSDYAHKLRTVWMPEGESAGVGTAQTGEGADLELPVGSILSKTFYYPLVGSVAPAERGSARRVRRDNEPDLELVGNRLPLDGVRLLETRLLVRRAQGWAALPYVWNEEQTEAYLEVAGDQADLELVDVELVDVELADGASSSSDAQEDTREGVEPFLYIVPDVNQCAGCHATNHTDKLLRPIGPKIRHLDRDVVYAEGARNQLEHWVAIGYLTAEALNARSSDATALASLAPDQSLEQQARAYLDINCGHCHNPSGPADTSGLFLDAGTLDLRRLGLCKPPVAAGRGSGDRLVSIHPGRPDLSIMTFRMDSTDPGIAMPELGRSTVHREGVELIGEWIAALPGDCHQVLGGEVAASASGG